MTPGGDAWEQWLASLSTRENGSARRKAFDSSPLLHTSEALGRLHQEVVRHVYTDTVAASRLAEAALWLGEMLGDERSLGIAARCQAHAAYAYGDYRGAVTFYERALAYLRGEGNLDERGRTLSSGMQSLIYLSRYEDALQWAGEARAIFQKAGDALRLARLTSNTGNIWYRLDRYEEALVCYEEAWHALPATGDPKDVAAAGSNVAVCRISLGLFTEALTAYREVRDYCLRHNLALLVAGADYNIAYLYFLRGEYAEAIRLYAETRRHCVAAGDAYHAALCNLDESEMYLEMNLIPEADALSREAVAAFGKLGMSYEQAKALAFAGLAAGRGGDLPAARRAFRLSRRLFAEGGNTLWPAMIDIYHALLLERAGEYKPALRHAELARRSLRRWAAPGRLAMCDVLRARLLLRTGQASEARQACEQAGRTAQSASAHYQIHYLRGRICEQEDELSAAYAHYVAAKTQLEDLRGGLPVEEWRIALLEDKRETYQRLAHLCLSGSLGITHPWEEAFHLFEQARSRTLFEAMLQAPPPSTDEDGQVESLRFELNACYRQLEAAGLRLSGSTGPLGALRRKAETCEQQLLQCIAQRRLGHASDPFDARNVLDYRQFREVLPEETTLLEYAIAGGNLYACIATRGELRIVPLGPAGDARLPLRLLQFQLARRVYPDSPNADPAAALDPATASHLNLLHRQLIQPLRHLLRTRRLVIAPHGFLHQLPFHALRDGARYLIDEFDITYTPSASVFAVCGSRSLSDGETLIAAFADQRAPHITREAQLVAAAIPQARLLLDQNATIAAFRRHGPASRVIHLATHAVFRPDNPMFSALRLGDGYLSLWETRQLRLAAQLVVLSGCGTGLNVVAGADELLGLVRGFLAAGARQVVVSLWDVNDNSTADLMGDFHRRRVRGASNSDALREAMLHLRKTFPHPVYWAPFVVTGG